MGNNVAIRKLRKIDDVNKDCMRRSDKFELYIIFIAQIMKIDLRSYKKKLLSPEKLLGMLREKEIDKEYCSNKVEVECTMNKARKEIFGFDDFPLNFRLFLSSNLIVNVLGENPL